jgi:hypothetical protein
MTVRNGAFISRVADVFLVAVVMVVGDVAGVVVSHLARRVCVSAPDGLAFGVLVPRGAHEELM